MAYITKEQIKEVRQNLKKAFPKFKFSVRSYHHNSGVTVSIMESTLKFDKEYQQLNEYHLDRYEHGKTLQKIKNIITGVKSCYNRNANDLGADYADMTYFLNMEIGKWNKPYKQTIKKCAERLELEALRRWKKSLAA